MRNRQKKKIGRLYLLPILLIVVIGIGYIVGWPVRIDKSIKGATVEKTGDFRLTAENKWDPDAKKIMRNLIGTLFQIYLIRGTNSFNQRMVQIGL